MYNKAFIFKLYINVINFTFFYARIVKMTDYENTIRFSLVREVRRKNRI